MNLIQQKNLRSFWLKKKGVSSLIFFAGGQFNKIIGKGLNSMHSW